MLLYSYYLPISFLFFECEEIGQQQSGTSQHASRYWSSGLLRNTKVLRYQVLVKWAAGESTISLSRQEHRRKMSHPVVDQLHILIKITISAERRRHGVGDDASILWNQLRLGEIADICSVPARKPRINCGLRPIRSMWIWRSELNRRFPTPIGFNGDCRIRITEHPASPA